MANKKFGAKEVMDVTFYEISTGKPKMHCDTLKVSGLDNKAGQVSARGGKGNAKIITWDIDREASLTLQDALVSTRGMELLTGNKVTIGSAKIYMRQYTQWELADTIMTDKGSNFPLIASGAGAVTLAFTPNEVAGSILVYDAQDDGGTPLAVGTLSAKILTNIAWAGKSLIVYYTYNVSQAETYLITSDKFAGTYRIVGDTVIRNSQTGMDEAFQMTINNAKVKSDFKLEFKADGDPSPFDMNVEVLRESGNTKMVTMVQYNNANAV
jgi:hypothetical protein